MRPDLTHPVTRHARLFELIRQEAVLCERREASHPAPASDVMSARAFLASATRSLELRSE